MFSVERRVVAMFNYAHVIKTYGTVNTHVYLTSALCVWRRGPVSEWVPARDTSVEGGGMTSSGTYRLKPYKRLGKNKNVIIESRWDPKPRSAGEDQQQIHQPIERLTSALDRDKFTASRSGRYIPVNVPRIPMDRSVCDPRGE